MLDSHICSFLIFPFHPVIGFGLIKTRYVSDTEMKTHQQQAPWAPGGLQEAGHPNCPTTAEEEAKVGKRRGVVSTGADTGSPATLPRKLSCDSRDHGGRASE